MVVGGLLRVGIPLLRGCCRGGHGRRGRRGLRRRVDDGGKWYLHQKRRRCPKEVTRLKVGVPCERNGLLAVGDEDGGVGKEIIAGKHVDHVIPGERWSAGLAYQVYVDEGWSDRKRECLGAGVPEVENVARGMVVEDEGGGAVGVVVEKGKFAKGWSG